MFQLMVTNNNVVGMTIRDESQFAYVSMLT